MKGGCFCGAVRYAIEGAIKRTTNCHCQHCRRTSGAPFLTWITVDTDRLRIVAGAPARYTSRPGVTRQCCAACGTQLTYHTDEDTDVIDVTACSLDSLEGITPEDHLWCDRMVPYLKLADGLPRYGLRRSEGPQKG
jgi:hypothetical protein